MAVSLQSSFSFTDVADVSPSVTPDRGLQGDGIAFAPTTGDLFVIRTDAPTGPASRVQSVLQFNTDGTYVGEFDFGTIGQAAVGGTVLPNGNLLVVALNPGANQTFATRLIEVAPDGTVPTGGIDLALPAEFNDRAQRGLVVGVAYSPAYTTNSRLRSKDATILVITSRSQEIVEFDLQGNIVSSVDLSQYGVTAPQGLAINPATGNIFVADEATTSGGTNKIYEISPLRDELAVVARNNQLPRFGSLVSIIETSQEFGLTDPEGLAFNANGPTLYAVFDGDDAAPTTQLTLDNTFTFDFSDGEGLAFRASDNFLFVLQASTTNSPVWNVYQYDTSGNQIGTAFTVDLGAFGPQDITVRSDNGNLILSGLDLNTFQQRFVEIDPTNQTQASGGIDFSFAAGFTSDVFSGVFYNSTTQTLFATDYLSKSVVEFDPTTGAVKTTNSIEHRWDVGSLIASRTFSPQAITYDATTGHYFLAGDVDSGNLIYEVGLGFSTTDGTPIATLYEASNTELTFGIQDAEGLAIDPNTRTLYASFDNDRFDLTTFGAVTVANIGGKVARAALTTNENNQVVTFGLQPTSGIPTLKTIDKFGIAGQAITLTVEDFTTIPAQNFAPDVPAFSGTTLAGITILALPSAGTLTLNGAVVSIGDVITADQIPALSYASNTDFSGVDTFQVSASDGTASSAPAHIDLFVSSPTASQLTATDTFSIDLGVPDDDRFNNSADGIVFNPVTNKVYTSSSFRIVPTDPETIGWRLIESNPDGSDPRVILQSEAQADANGPTPFTPLTGVTVVDLVAGTQTDGIQDLAVVQGTGTARDGNLLILSTRGALVREITPDGVFVDGGINFDAPGLFELNGAFDRSAVGMVHAVENGQEFIYVTDFGERLIRKVPALTGSNAAPANLTEAQVVSTIALQSALPESRLQDLTIDSLTGNFFVADDASGNAAIYEITPDGTVLGATDMLALGEKLGIEQGFSGQALTDFVNKFADLEGISIDPATRTLYAAIDDDGVGQFGLDYIGRQVVAIGLTPAFPSTGRLILQDSFSFTDEADVSPSVTPDRGLQGDGIAFDPTTGDLFVIRTDAPTGPASRVQSVLQFNTDGTYVGEFDFGTIGQVAVGGTVLPNGNLLVVALNPGANQTFATRLIEVAPDGTVPTGGIDLALPAEFNDRNQRGLVVGVAYSPAYATNNRFRSKEASILVITSRSQEIVEFDLSGNIIASLDLSKYGVTAPQGLAINPANGNIFIADEAATSGGTNKIYEISPLRDELAVVGTNTGIPRFGSLVSITDTAAAFGLTDPEGLTFGNGTLYAVFDGDDAAGSNKVAAFSVQTPTGLPTLRTLDKFTVAGVASNFALTEFTTQAAQDFAPTVPVFTTTTGSLASITVLSLPEFGGLTLNGAAVTLGQTIAAADIANLSYQGNADFSGVDTFQISAFNGTASSAPAHVDLFVSATTARKLTATDTFNIDLGNFANDDRFDNSADGLVFNPINGKVYTASSFRINPTDASTIGWRLIESDPDGANPRVVLQSEADALAVTGQTPFTPLVGVPVLDLVPNDTTDGVQDLGVVLGTGTARDGNILVLSTRGASIFEVTPDGTPVANGINISAPGLFEAGGALSRSAVGLLHTVENGQEYIYVTDFGERLIRKVPARTGTIANPAILTTADVISEIKLQTALPEARLQGITVDPITGNFFVADDASGNAAIYEIKPDGTIVGSTDMLALGRELGLSQGLIGTALTDFINKFADLEGITIDPETRTLYAAIDDDGVGQFGLDYIGRQVVAIGLTPAFPTTIVTGTPDADLIQTGINDFTGINSLVFSGAGNDEVDIPIGGANLGSNRIFTGSGSDVIAVADGDRAFGGSGADEFEATDAEGYRLSGGAGDDQFFLGVGGRALGGDGDDRFFVGEGGDNLLSGGAGTDAFWILTDAPTLLGSANTIVDYTIGTDVIGIANQFADSVEDLTLNGSNISLNGVLVATLNGVNAADATFVFGTPLA